MEWPKIDAKTDLGMVKEIHKRIWNWVIANGEKPETPYVCDCVYCEYSRLHFFESKDKRKLVNPNTLCSVCPIFDCLPLVKRYNRETKANGPFSEKAIDLAKMIRDLPDVKEDENEGASSDGDEIHEVADRADGEIPHDS